MFSLNLKLKTYNSTDLVQPNSPKHCSNRFGREKCLDRESVCLAGKRSNTNGLNSGLIFIHYQHFTIRISRKLTFIKYFLTSSAGLAGFLRGLKPSRDPQRDESMFIENVVIDSEISFKLLDFEVF